MMSALRCVIHRDLLLAVRRSSDVLTVLLFFVIVVSLFPLGVGPDPALLRTIAPGVIWVAALLASMLALQRMFASDHADGTLEQMLLGATPLGMTVAAKVLAHWLISGLPLVLISPVLALIRFPSGVPRNVGAVPVPGNTGAEPDRRDRHGA